jgi:hypothetical protein
MQKLLVLGIAFLTLHSCSEVSTENKTKDSFVQEKISNTDTSAKLDTIAYYRFSPDSIADLTIKGFQIDHSYRLGNRNLITGYYEPDDGKIVPPDTEKDYGHRLLFLKGNEIMYKSIGVGDTYLYEPYFFKNNKNDKTIVICQQAYEYFFGGNAFLVSNDNITSIGNIDVESEDPETKMVNIVNISEIENKIVFSFKSASLILQPGEKDIQVKNNHVRYEYDGNTLKFIR